MQTFTLNIDIILGPLSPAQAAEAEALLNGLQINVGDTVIIIIIIIIIPGRSPHSQPGKRVMTCLTCNTESGLGSL